MNLRIIAKQSYRSFVDGMNVIIIRGIGLKSTSGKVYQLIRFCCVSSECKV